MSGVRALCKDNEHVQVTLPSVLIAWQQTTYKQQAEPTDEKSHQQEASWSLRRDEWTWAEIKERETDIAAEGVSCCCEDRRQDGEKGECCGCGWTHADESCPNVDCLRPACCSSEGQAAGAAATGGAQINPERGKRKFCGVFV